MAQKPGGGSTLLLTTDAGEIYDEVVAAVEEAVGEPLYPGDERRIFAEALSMVLARARGTVNDAARQVMLRYARGEVLDALGARLGVSRIPPEPARTVLEFRLASELAHDVEVPAGTRATTDGSVYFATTERCSIAAGALAASAPAECTEAGEAGNGYPAGSLSELVDLVPYVAAVANTAPTGGGDDGEAYDEDGDGRLRERILMAPGRLSTAGPEMGYVYWAMSADAGIADAAALSRDEALAAEVPVRAGHAYLGGELLEPEGLTVDGSPDGFSWTYEGGLLDIELSGEAAAAESVEVSLARRMDGRVRVVVLMEGGGAPDEDVLESVRAAVNARSVRPMTDVVEVEGPEFVDYSIDLTYWAAESDLAAVAAAVEGPGGAIERYVADQSAALGRDINPDVLRTYAMRPDWDGAAVGAVRCEVREPSYAALGPGQVARLSGAPSVEVRVVSEARWS